MKFLRLFIIVLTAGFIFSSCQKEFSAEAGNARGSLKEDATGDCAPVITGGTFKKDSVLKTTNYVDIQVNITQTGTYFVKSDTVNGYSFSAAGAAVVTGTNTIRLLASGKPITQGVDAFTIKFDTSQCEFNITVTGTSGGSGGGTAVYTLGGSPGLCTGATLSGIYIQGIPTSGSNTATVNVMVTQAGTYTLSTGAINGVTFSGTGSFSATGANTILLTASGIPTASGPVTYPISSGTSNCDFSVTYAPGVPPATYTIDCSGATTTGTYQALTPTTSANKVTISATSTGPGSYSITTNTVNGISFSGSGFFTGPATQPAVLTATGTPLAAGTFIYTATAATGGSTCTFSVIFTSAPPSATYTIDCSGAIPAGTYQANLPTTPANTVTISATSTGPGAYNITTNTVNGISFSGSGSFPGPGTPTVMLAATGTPLAAGTFSYTATAATGGSTCTFSVTFAGAPTPPMDFITANVDGVATTFNINIAGVNDNTSLPGFTILNLSGDASATGNEAINLTVTKSGTSIGPGIYTVNQAPGTIVVGNYTDPANDDYIAQPDGTTQPTPFTIVISTITATRVTGTFSGPVKDNSGMGPGVKQINNGQFSVPL